MIPPDRIERAAIPHKRLRAAARALIDADDEIGEGARLDYEDVAARIIKAAYPELAAGTHWIAPNEATEDMVDAVRDNQPYGDRGGRERRDFDNEWSVARDAYLSQPDKDET